MSKSASSVCENEHQGQCAAGTDAVLLIPTSAILLINQKRLSRDHGVPHRKDYKAEEAQDPVEGDCPDALERSIATLSKKLTSCQGCAFAGQADSEIYRLKSA